MKTLYNFSNRKITYIENNKVVDFLPNTFKSVDDKKAELFLKYSGIKEIKETIQSDLLEKKEVKKINKKK